MTIQIQLDNKCAIVTGASKGIGLAIATRLAEAGASVLLVARGARQLEQSCLELRDRFGEKIVSFQGDVSDADLPDRLFQYANKSFGFIDILVNNSGGPDMGSFLDVEDNQWNYAIQSCLLGPVRLSRKFAEPMMEKGWGRIINITSTLAKEPTERMVLSSTTRAGLHAFSKAVSKELAERNVLVNSICPGGVATERLIELIEQRAQNLGVKTEDYYHERQKNIPIRRFADPEEIANVATFLCSDLASYITGININVDGSLTASML